MVTSSASSSSASGGSDGWSSDSFSSDDDNDAEAADTFASGGDRRASSERLKKHARRRESRVGADGGALPLRPRGLRMRKSSFSGASAVRDQSARAYAEALRTVRLSVHRGSISVGAANSGIAPISEETRRRHRESKKRMECADRTQRVLFRAFEQDATIADAPLWLHARVVPPRWRVQIAAHLTAIHAQVQFCRGRVERAWHLLLPPFDRANLDAYEARLAQLERSVASMDTAVAQCETLVAGGEREAAAVFLQCWFRRCLARRGFYTRTLRLSRQSRGLIPGMFDTIAGTSRLTIQPRAAETTLEYPTASASAKHAFR